jgi:hypothetical protein
VNSETTASNELVKASAVSVPATGDAWPLPELVERAGGAARFAWDEFFFAEHHNPHTQAAYQRAEEAMGGSSARGRRIYRPTRRNASTGRISRLTGAIIGPCDVGSSAHLIPERRPS